MILKNIFGALARFLYYVLGWFRASFYGVKLGRGAHISPKATIRGVAFLGRVDVAAGVVIGYGSYINSGHVSSGSIGKYCSIAYNVIIGPAEHRLDHWTTSPFESLYSGEPIGETDRSVPPPVIEDGVWIGANAVILRGVHIAEGAVIAAGAVVNRDVPKGEIWGGVPARFIGKRQIVRKIRDGDI
ncbi:MAG: maltose O-acetyltransferase [Alloalcanivorax sp.]|jgi:acetyltransferase-like isoleucine patch superfamily enzyme